ncbi:MAG TPA: class I SAM-dependent methyltransferase [Gaiellaceae bacterium]|jgi:SAM-dependent methyltransferase|nr:class I SAM-dependent methyltransferase [Gaiellaceae bacterium]
MQRDNWDELFDEIYLSTYSPRLDEVESAEEALAAARLAGVEPPAQILDAPGGFGRHSIPLAESGYQVTSVDRSPVQLEEARRRAGEAEWPRFVQADIRELPFEDESFDAVLNLFSSIGYRGEEGDRQMLTEFLRVLRPGRALLIETMHRDRLMAIFQPHTWEPLDGQNLVAEARSFDHVAGEVETEHILVAGGSRRSFTYRIRCYTATELTRMLEGMGFGEIECFGDYDGAELARETRLVIRARKVER